MTDGRDTWSGKPRAHQTCTCRRVWHAPTSQSALTALQSDSCSAANQRNLQQFHTMDHTRKGAMSHTICSIPPTLNDCCQSQVLSLGTSRWGEEALMHPPDEAVSTAQRNISETCHEELLLTKI